MSKEKLKPLSPNPSDYRLSFGSLSSSMENFINQEHQKLLPEILVTKEKEEPQTENIPKKIEFLSYDKTASSASSSPNTFHLSSFSFAPLKSSDLQSKSSETTSSIASSEEEDYKEKLKNVKEVISGLPFPSTSLYTEDSSSSSVYAPIPIPVPAAQLESRLLEITKSTSIHCATQTRWMADDPERPLTDPEESLTNIQEKLPTEETSKSTKFRLKQNQMQVTQSQTTSPESLKPEGLKSPFQRMLLDKKEASSSQEGSVNSQSTPQGIPSPSRTYQTVFKCILKELLEREEKTALDIDVSPSARLRHDTRRKLAHMFKTNFERYKDVFKRILKRRRPTTTYNLTEATNVINIEEYRIIHVPEVSPVASAHELVVMDEEWVEEVTKFPSYPSGHVALIISHTEDSDIFTYMIFKDEEKLSLLALLNNLGHATFYNEDENIWLSLGLNLGFYFDEKGKQKAWNWWDPKQHIHAPPYQSINFELNSCIDVHIKTQDKVLITFTYYKQKIHLNLGTKVKVKDSETETQLQNKPILETHKMQEQFQTANSLLKKMKGLNRLSKSDLENFIQGYSPMSMVEERLRAGKLSMLFTTPPRA